MIKKYSLTSCSCFRVAVLSIMFFLISEKPTHGLADNCSQPLAQNSGTMSKLTTNYLRATIISTSPLVSRVSCTASCMSVSSCVYIGLNTAANTCSLLAAAASPAVEYKNFTDVYIIESRAVQVSKILLVCL